MQPPAPQNLKRRLIPAAHRYESYRIEADNKAYVDFSSNDYLGLSSHPLIKSKLKEALDLWPAGSTGSRLLSGDYQVLHDFEFELACFLGVPKVLLFNSGYHANLGAIPAFMTSKDGIFADKLSHASMIDGCRLSGATLHRFRHQHLDHLRALLTAHRASVQDAWIMTESIFSMEGDVTDFAALVALKKEFKARLYIDDSHGFGIWGEHGHGAIPQELMNEVDILVNGFGKGMGLYGGMVGGSHEDCETLIQGCRSFLFSTALPPFLIEGLRQGLTLVKAAQEGREHVHKLSSYFREGCAALGYQVLGSSQIIPVVIGEEEKTVALSEFLRSKGFWVMPIRYPTVPLGQARLRFSLTVHHTHEQLEQVLDLLKSAQSHI